MASDPLAHGVLSWLLTYALHSTALLVFVWGLTSALGGVVSRRTSLVLVRERLWKIAIVGGALTASVSSLLPNTPGLPDFEIIRPRPVVENALTVAAPFAPLRSDTIDTIDTTYSPVEVAPAPLQPALWVQPEPTVAALPELSAPLHARTWPWMQIVLAIWIAGVAIGTARWLGEWRRLFRCLAGRTEITAGPARDALDALVRRHPPARSIRLTRAAHLPVPITLGFVRREICLPPAAETALQSDEIAAVLGHETAHAVRRDPLWLCICRAFEIVFFFQPLNRVARVRLQEDCEALCDDWSVVHTGERVALASSLAEIAGWLLDSPPRLPAPGMVVHRSRLSQRVQRLLDSEHRPELSLHARRWSLAAAVPCASVALAVPAISIHHDASIDEFERVELHSSVFEDGAPLFADRVAGGAPLFVAPAVFVAQQFAAGTRAATTEDECKGVSCTEEPDSLDAQIEALEHELEELQLTRDEVELSDRAREQLAAIERQFEAVRDLQARVHDLVQRIPDREPSQ
ncbi:MAG: M56 family metallopeptidase [Planctomycetota bacterium]